MKYIILNFSEMNAIFRVTFILDIIIHMTLHFSYSNNNMRWKLHVNFLFFISVTSEFSKCSRKLFILSIIKLRMIFFPQILRSEWDNNIFIIIISSQLRQTAYFYEQKWNYNNFLYCVICVQVHSQNFSQNIFYCVIVMYFFLLETL